MEVSVLCHITESNIIRCLAQIFATHEFPEIVDSDNAAQFTSSDFKEFLAVNAVHHQHITPYWPQANGEVERQNRTLCQAIRSAHSVGKDWHTEMYIFLLAYRSTPHSVTCSIQNCQVCQLSVYVQQVTLILLGRKRVDELLTKTGGLGTIQYKEGNQVLLRQTKRNKLSTTFKPELVVDRKGQSDIIEKHVVKTMQHISFVKKKISTEMQVVDETAIWAGQPLGKAV